MLAWDGMSAETLWVVISHNQTSIGAWEWILRRGTLTAHVLDLPRGGGVRALFTDAAEAGKGDVCALFRDLRAEAHAARCYALACDKIADFAESGHLLDARPVHVGGGSLEINGADALVALRFYFEEAFFAVDLERDKFRGLEPEAAGSMWDAASFVVCCEKNDR